MLFTSLTKVMLPLMEPQAAATRSPQRPDKRAPSAPPAHTMPRLPPLDQRRCTSWAVAVGLSPRLTVYAVGLTVCVQSVEQRDGTCVLQSPSAPSDWMTLCAPSLLNG